jgi:2,4-dienoyl-CoA reductase-like NADH-dependent reductase (Old Yellow Enzyme family)
MIIAFSQKLHELSMSQFIRQHYRGALIGCGSYTTTQAEKALADGRFDLIAFGRPFIANANLVTLIQNQQPINAYDVSMLATLS